MRGPTSIRAWRPSALLLAAAVALASAPAAAIDALVLHRIGPWPWAHSLVAYRDRLWLANGDRTREQPAADLYSFDPREGRLRYERRLFSQGAGRPVVHEGLLHWPFEDPRYSLDVAHVAVTDGRRWGLRTVADEVPLLHATALASDGRTLWLTCTTPGLRVFARRGGAARFAPVGPPPPPEAPLHWILRAEPHAGGLYGIAIDRMRGRDARRTLVRLDGGHAVPVPGLPDGANVIALTRGGEGLLAVVEEEDRRRSLWTSNGRRLVPRAPGPDQGRLRDVAVDEGAIWALTLNTPGSRVWRREEDGAWRAVADLHGGDAQELVIHDGRPYAVGRARGWTGAFWAPPPAGDAASARSAASRAPAWPRPEPRDVEASWQDLAGRARAALERPEAYRDRAREAREALLALARSAAPAQALDALLEAAFPPGSAPMLRSGVPVARQILGPWLVFWAMAVGERGHVPVAELAAPWSQDAPGGRGKAFAPLLAALAALHWNGQADPATIDALVARLQHRGDPVWLRADVVGALTAITGQRFGDDAMAWRGWWQEARPGQLPPAAGAPRAR